MRDRKGRSLIALPSDYTVIDTETTGLDYGFDDIIEISAIKYINGEKKEVFTTFVKPPVSFALDDNDNEIAEYVSSFITELTGITNEMLADAPEPTEVFPEFLRFIGSSTLIGHNVNFDINFIYDACERYCGHPLTNDFIDTMRIARKLFPDLKHHRLRDIAGRCNAEQHNAHRSEADCITTAQCYEYMKRLALAQGSETEFKNLFKRNRNTRECLANISATTPDIDETNPIYGKTVVFTGALESMERKNAFQIVVNLGGLPQDRVTKKTNFLIIGSAEFAQSVRDGKTSKMKTAESYQIKGCDILTLSEKTFFDMISPYI